MAKYLSGRFKKTPQNALRADRYRYLSPGDAEPNIGDPVFPGQTPPFGQQYQIVSVEGYPGERYWIPIGGGVIPGSITVFDEGNIRGGLNSTTQLNFTGLAITAVGTNNGLANPGIAVTISVFAPGNNQEILFNESKDFSTSSKLTFDKSLGLLRAGDRLIVGTGGTVITTTGFGSVGIGTIDPSQELHVQGDVRITGTIYDYFNDPGATSYIIAKNNFGGISWINPSTVRSGAGGTYQNVQFHNSVGLVDGASNFVYDEVNKRVGIGSTQPSVLLDVLGVSKFTGPTQISDLNVIGITTTQTLAVSGTTTTRNLLVSGVTTLGFLNGSNAVFTGIVTANKFVGEITLTNLDVPGVATIGTLKVTGLTTTKNLQVIENTSLNNVSISGITTFGSQVNINNLNVTGVGTFDNIKLDTNTVSTNTGNLILDSAGGTTQVNDSIYINDTTESTSKDTGSIITEGGVGIEKNLFVGGRTNLIGITTVINDLYVGGNLYVVGDITYDEINGRRAVFSEYLETKDFKATGISTLNILSVGSTASFNNTVNFNDIANFNANVALGNSITDTVTFTSLVNSNIIPSLNNNYNLGSISNRWNTIWASTFNGSVTGNSDTASRLQTPRNIDLDGEVIGVGAGETFDGSRNITIITELSTTGVSSGTYGSSTQVGQFSVDTKGRIKSASNINIDFSAAVVSRAGYADSAGIATNLRGGNTYQIPYQNTTGVTSFIGTSNALSGYLLQYNGSSAPSWVSPTGLAVTRASYADEAGLATNLKINATNRLLIQTGVNTTGVLTSGNANQLLQSNGANNAPTWVDPSGLSISRAGYADSAGIATNLRGGNAYQIPYQSAPNTTQFIANGTTQGQILQYNTTSAPSWVDPSGLSISRAGYADSAGIATNLRGGNAYQIPYQNTTGVTSFISTTGAQAGWLLQYNTTSAPSWVAATGLTASKASYADEAGLSTNLKINAINRLLIQTNNNISGVLTSGNANQLLQSNGANNAPTWVDPVGLSVSYANRAGVAVNLELNGTNSLLYQRANNDSEVISVGNTGELLQSNGGESAPTWVPLSNLTATRASYADRAGISTNIANGKQYELVYQTGPNQTGFIATSSSPGYILQYNGGNLAPTWVSPSNLTVKNATGATNLLNGNTYEIPYQSAPNTTQFISTTNVQDGWILKYNTNSAPSWVALTSISAGLATAADDLTFPPLALNPNKPRLVVQWDAYDTRAIGPGTTGYLLRSNGIGTFPSWVALTSAISEFGGITVEKNNSTVGLANSTNILNFDDNFTISQEPLVPKQINISLSTSSGAAFPAGTTLVFYQASAPTGWTQVTTHTNKALRVVSGTGGGSGGTIGFTGVFSSNRIVPLVDHNHSITDPGHSHTLTAAVGVADKSQNGENDNEAANQTITTGISTTGITINSASATQLTGNTMNFDVQYIDVILCSKN